jgi:F-type H+-transporting ATPase subunit delta
MLDANLARTSQTSAIEVGTKFSDSFSELSAEVCEQIAREFFAFVEALVLSESLQRALVNPVRDVADRQALVKTVLKSLKPHKLTVAVIEELVGKKWSKPSDFRAAVGEFGFTILIFGLSARKTSGTSGKATTKATSAERELEKVETQLFVFAERLRDLSSSSREVVRLREYLSSSHRSLEGRLQIVEQLIGQESKGGKNVDSATVLLAKYATTSVSEDGGRYVTNLKKISDRIAAARKKRVVDVVSAIPLNKAQLERLEGLLAQKYNSQIQMNVVIDESVLGGLKIVADGNIFDTTLLHNFNNFKNKFDMDFKA